MRLFGKWSFLWCCLMIGCVNVKEFEKRHKALFEENPLSAFNVSAKFDYKTTKNITVVLEVPDFLNSAVFQLYSKTDAQDSLAIGRAVFDANGHFEKEFSVSQTADRLILVSDYVGLIKDISLPIVDGVVIFDYREAYQNSSSGKTGHRAKIVSKSSNAQVDFDYLDTYNNQGVPDNLAVPDRMTRRFLNNINATIPEKSKRIPVTYEEYLMEADKQLILSDAADVWATFVSEGTKNRNSLGFYSYPVGQPPQSVDEIDVHTIIFPNASMVRSKGGLVPGHKVFLGNFPANTVIAWFLVENGWKNRRVNNDGTIFYSNPDFNENNSSGIPHHTVLLYNQELNLTLIGFEDLGKRDAHDDFNDVVFYVKSSPENAIQINNITFMAVADDEDGDGDGIVNELDDYPNDPNKAFNNYVPSAESSGKLLYEDLWPSTGDYDFNDLALDYRYNLIANSDNLITNLEGEFTIEKIGGSLQNGFGFVLPIDPVLIQRIEGQMINGGYENVADNGTEVGTNSDETVVIVIGNVANNRGTVIDISITFKRPLLKEELGEIPFNPFLIVNGDRGREVHLPDSQPTSKADYLGTFDDKSNPSEGIYYKTNRNLPWALNVYDDRFIIPFEGISIIEQYPRFINWANSGGTQDLDWYIE